VSMRRDFARMFLAAAIVVASGSPCAAADQEVLSPALPARGQFTVFDSGDTANAFYRVCVVQGQGAVDYYSTSDGVLGHRALKPDGCADVAAARIVFTADSDNTVICYAFLAPGASGLKPKP
jgi:hypothetical protein